ncbi:MAG: carotenoid oxygenase family protein [Actinomycetota bacterium]
MKGFQPYRPAEPELAEGAPPYSLGFQTLESEVDEPVLTTTGTIPSWVSGTLLRTGPAKFEVGSQKYNHWFDGLGMLHRFELNNGDVSYSNRFIQSRAYLHAMENDQISFREFATDPDPEKFKYVSQGYEAHGTDNAIVNVVQIGDKVLAMTQTPLPIEFDPKSLKTVGVYDFDDSIPDGFTTPNPHVDPLEKLMYNFTISLDPPVSHHLYRFDGQTRELITSITTDAPAFVNSFALTERYVILVECPYRLDYMKLIAGKTPFAKCFDWKPEETSIFWIIDRSDGEVVRRFDTEAFFSLHHINAYQLDDEFVVDMVTYEDPEIIESLYLDNLRSGGTIPKPETTRFRLNLLDDNVTVERLGDAFIELPRINYNLVNGKEYRYFYGFGGYGTMLRSQPVTFDNANSLVKVDVQTKQSKAWQAEGCFPGEPVFVADPEGTEEDDGVLLSVVLDTSVGKSFLLVVDARTMAELGRAGLPHHVPFSLGGNFFTDAQLQQQDMFAEPTYGEQMWGDHAELPEAPQNNAIGAWMKLLGRGSD